MCSMIFNIDHSSFSWKKKTSETKRKPMHQVYLPFCDIDIIPVRSKFVPPSRNGLNTSNQPFWAVCFTLGITQPKRCYYPPLSTKSEGRGWFSPPWIDPTSYSVPSLLILAWRMFPSTFRTYVVQVGAASDSPLIFFHCSVYFFRDFLRLQFVFFRSLVLFPRGGVWIGSGSCRILLTIHDVLFLVDCYVSCIIFIEPHPRLLKGTRTYGMTVDPHIHDNTIDSYTRHIGMPKILTTLQEPDAHLLSVQRVLPTTSCMYLVRT